MCGVWRTNVFFMSFSFQREFALSDNWNSSVTALMEAAVRCQSINFFLLFLVSIKVNQLWNWIRCPSEFGDECYLLWLYRSSLNQQLLLVINNWLIMAWFNYYKIKWIMSSRFLSHDGWWRQSPNKLLRVKNLTFLFKSSICLEVVSNWTGSFFKSFFFNNCTLQGYSLTHYLIME